MMATATHEASPNAGRNDHRSLASTPLSLIEIERAKVVDTIVEESADPEGVYSVGAMRELCPHCRTNHLKLVLRQKRVRQSHLFCEVCDKCFDARYLDGTSALAVIID
ncbi:MAG TPA: hypothetical protein VF472_11655 [Burkholderiaceae bacterium]